MRHVNQAIRRTHPIPSICPLNKRNSDETGEAPPPPSLFFSYPRHPFTHLKIPFPTSWANVRVSSNASSKAPAAPSSNPLPSGMDDAECRVSCSCLNTSFTVTNPIRTPRDSIKIVLGLFCNHDQISSPKPKTEKRSYGEKNIPHLFEKRHDRFQGLHRADTHRCRIDKVR